MSEATRAIALQHAVHIHGAAGDHTTEAILKTAETFHNFMNGGDAETAPAPAKPATAARLAAAAAAKPAAKPAATAAKKPPAKSEEQLVKEATDRAAAEAEAEGPTKDQIGQAVEDLLKANLRIPAVALLKKHGAKSVSEVPEESYADFLEEANGLLLGA